jgi:hypothetical protein
MLNSCRTYTYHDALPANRLIKKKIPTHFPAEWVPLLHEAAEGFSFNWDKILSDNLSKEVTEYQTAKSKGQPMAFYMSSYIMDAICFMTPFPLMNWSWNPTSNKPIHEYYSKLWEENAKDSFYEICHFVVILVHQMLYGCEPPRISESVMESLKAVIDWFIEEIFSYIRVFGCSIPPHALPKSLPDRLVCREVAHQIVIGGIENELKMAQKRFWPIFPVQVGKYSLLNLGHSKVEAATLGEIKLLNLDHRKYDPHKIVGNHQVNCNLKAYEHEQSPCDDMFRGVISYDEVLARFQSLSPDLQNNFLNFQKHRRSGLPRVLLGEASTQPPEQGSIPPGFGSGGQDKENTKRIPEETEESPRKTEGQKAENSGMEKGSQTPPVSDKLDFPSSSTIHGNTPKTTEEVRSTELGAPIASLTPLQSTFGFPQLGALYVSDLEPISREEIPPSDYFFSKKRKAVLKQEMHQRENAMVKKHKIIIDGQNLEEEDFATEVAGSMGALATTNQFTVENMKARLRQRNLMIAKLQGQLKENEKRIEEGINKGLDQARAGDKQEIQSLKTSLSEMEERVQTSQMQEEIINQLQTKLKSIEDLVIDLKVFQAQSLEVHAELEVEQQKLISKIEILQNYFHEASNSFDNIIMKEKEAKAARVALQREIICSTNEETSKTTKLSATEKIRGDIMLKVWEANIMENKRIVKEIKDDCEEVFDLLDKGSLNIGKDNCAGLLGQINIARHQLKFKEDLSEIQMEISQLKEMDVTLINRLLIQPNLKLQSIKFADKRVEDYFPKIQRKVYLFEAKEFPEPPKTSAPFLNKCIECVREKEGESST